ncbi:MAG: glycosyltransferase, partial [Phycisphaeraceae bacterium]
MAARLPVIFTDCSGWPDDFQQDVHGRIVPTGDPDALADAIRQFAAMTPDQRQAMGEAGRRFAEERYDINVVGRRFAELVESVLESQPAAAG